MRSKKLLANLLFPIFGLFVIACMVLPIPIPMPAPVLINITKVNRDLPSTYDGNWEGTTSQETKITFTVKNNDVVNLYIKLNLSGRNCEHPYEFTFKNGSVATMEASGYYIPINPIEEDKFSITNDSGGISHIINATFTTPSSASGTMEVSDTASSCKGSSVINWSATKVSE